MFVKLELRFRKSLYKNHYILLNMGLADLKVPFDIMGLLSVTLVNSGFGIKHKNLDLGQQMF